MYLPDHIAVWTPFFLLFDKILAIVVSCVKILTTIE